VDVEKPKLQEIWNKTYYRWNEVNINQINQDKNYAIIETDDEDYLIDVPVDSFEIVKEEKNKFILD
jgi:hypothetical protein